MECPHCKKEDCIPPVVYRNIENYGSKVLVFRCFHCKKKIEVYGRRTVVFGKLRKTKKSPDWG